MSSQTEAGVPIQILMACAILLLTSCGKSEQQLMEERLQAETSRIAMETRKANEASVAKAAKKALEEKQRTYLQQMFRDDFVPSSDQFRNLRFVKGAHGEALCGEINEHAFRVRGRTGFWPFVVTERPMETSEPEDIMAQIPVYKKSRVYLFWSRDDDRTLSKYAQITFANAGCL